MASKISALPKAVKSVNYCKTLFVSGQIIPIFKGTLCYTLAIVFILTSPIRDVFRYPFVLTYLVLLSIAGFSGKSTGQCWMSVILGLTGACVGAVFFVILNFLAVAPVAQGFVLAIILYLMALTKAQGMMWFAFSLIAILFSFGGILSRDQTGIFSSIYLQDYMRAFALGGGLVLAVNLFVFPKSAEKELRQLLVASLSHASTFSHLIDKTYDQSITEKDKATRDSLNKTIRGDFGLLQATLSASIVEINWSRWSIADYRQMVSRVKGLQTTLISMLTLLNDIEIGELKGSEAVFKHHLLPKTRLPFLRVRRIIDVLFTDIVEALELHHSATYQRLSPNKEPAHASVGNFDALDLELQQTKTENWSQSEETLLMGNDQEANENHFEKVSQRLRTEVAHTPAPTRPPSPNPDADQAKPAHAPLDPEKLHEFGQSLHRPKTSFQKREEHAREVWKIFKDVSTEVIIDLISQGTFIQPDAPLKVNLPQPSRTEEYTKQTEDELSAFASSRALIRARSLIASHEAFLEQLLSLHREVVKQRKPNKRIHFHLFEGMSPSRLFSGNKEAKPMPRREALSILQKKPYTKPKITFWIAIKRIELAFLSDTSIYAFKTMCATMVFAVLLLAPSTKRFFLQYNLTGGLITIIVAMAPVLGQTLLTFVLQILGTGFGTLWGLWVLSAFKGIGGWPYNPYGIACMYLVFAIPLNWVLYQKPQFFAGALLSMNAAGSLMVIMVGNQYVPTFTDSVPFRAAKAFVALAIALGLALAFQLLFLRRSARRTLRQTMAKIVGELMSYHLIFLSYHWALYTTDGEEAPDPAAVKAIDEDLTKREIEIQTQLIEIMPLMLFSSVEPSFVKKFNAKDVSAIIAQCQVILDRYKEGHRVAKAGFPPEIRELFLKHFVPYRKQYARYTKILFYVCQGSLATKRALPAELPNVRSLALDWVHDAMVISQKLLESPEGRALAASDGFARYWAFVLGSHSVGNALDRMQKTIKSLYGSLEEEAVNLHSWS